MLSSSSSSINCILFIITKLMLGLQCSFGCNSHLVQIIFYNSSYSHSLVSQQNNFGDGNGGAGGLNVNILNSPIIPDNTTTESIKLQNEHEQPFEENSNNASRHFGVELVPYVKSVDFLASDYTSQDIKDMLSVIITKSHSVLTMGMGFTELDSMDGPWNTTAPSQIATTAAQLNRDNGSMLLSICQGADVFSSDEGSQQDIEAAFYSAVHANSIYPQTVWGITLIPNYYPDASTKQSVVEMNKTDSILLTQLQKHYIPAHNNNLKLGVLVNQCEGIIDGSFRETLLHMAHQSDYIICSIYPTKAVSDPQEYFNVVTNLYEEIERSFKEIVPLLEIILQTGWATRGKSKNNPEYMNSPRKSKKFWDLVENWAEEQKTRVFMHEAFDIPKERGNSSWGYWRWEDNGDYFEEKASENAVLI